MVLGHSQLEHRVICLNWRSCLLIRTSIKLESIGAHLDSDKEVAGINSVSRRGGIFGPFNQGRASARHCLTFVSHKRTGIVQASDDEQTP